MSDTSEARRSFFPSPALDHAFAGIMSGVISTVFLNPLDLLKTRFQVSTTGFSRDPSTRSPFYQYMYRSPLRLALIGGTPGLNIADALRDIVRHDGWRGLYRGIGPNVVGNASSWGLYYLWCVLANRVHPRQGPAGEDAWRRQVIPAHRWPIPRCCNN